MAGTAAAAGLVVDRDPYRARSGTRKRSQPEPIVASTSAVSVLVIDCTTIG